MKKTKTGNNNQEKKIFCLQIDKFFNRIRLYAPLAIFIFIVIPTLLLSLSLKRDQSTTVDFIAIILSAVALITQKLRNIFPKRMWHIHAFFTVFLAASIAIPALVVLPEGVVRVVSLLQLFFATAIEIFDITKETRKKDKEWEQQQLQKIKSSYSAKSSKEKQGNCCNLENKKEKQNNRTKRKRNKKKHKKHKKHKNHKNHKKNRRNKQNSNKRKRKR